MRDSTGHSMNVSSGTISNRMVAPPPQPSDRLGLQSASRLIGGILFPLVLLGFVYHESLVPLVNQWVGNETYSHGLLVPIVSAFLIWQKKAELVEEADGGSWWGLVVVGVGVALYVLGELATLFIVLHVSLWCILVGLLWSALGTRAMAIMAFPLGYLLTAIPLPQFLYQGLSGRLQLLSSALGVGCLQIVGVTAFREGNVIDLGPIQLQVVDACSGLRYLFPLTSLALLCAYLFKDRLWKRVLLFASSIPISILLNGFRIAMIGLLVEHFGPAAADGFFHLFEGWVFFVASLGVLLAEIWVLRSIGASGQSAPQAKGIGTARTAVAADGRPAFLAAVLPAFSRSTYLCSVGLLLLLPLASTQIVTREEIAPPRRPFLDFPMSLEGWTGTSFPLERQYVEALRFDDYALADYRRSDSIPVNLYVAYYGSQRKGQSAHSPQSCIPGGGWEITSMETLQLAPPGVDLPSRPVNRVLIQKGDQRQVVVYWFKQRDRMLTNEYLVKFYMVWDAMLRGRTDGALVRLTTAVRPGESDASAEQRVIEFARVVHPALRPYVPD